MEALYIYILIYICVCVCVWSWGDHSFDVKNVQIKTPAKKETKKTDCGDISATYLAMRILAWDLPVSCWAPASEIQLDPSSQEHCCCGVTLQIRSCRHRDPSGWWYEFSVFVWWPPKHENCRNLLKSAGTPHPWPRPRDNHCPWHPTVWRAEQFSDLSVLPHPDEFAWHGWGKEKAKGVRWSRPRKPAWTKKL